MNLAVYAVLFIVLVILIAHFIAPSKYNWRINSISELAAQRYKHGIVMRIGFIGFGVLLAWGAISSMKLEPSKIKYVPIIIYSVSVLVSGIFSTKPFTIETGFSAIESRIHSFCAQLAGFSFSMGVLLFFFYAEAMNTKIVHFSFFILVILLSMLFGKIQSHRGVMQRILYFTSFVWIILFIK